MGRLPDRQTGWPARAQEEMPFWDGFHWLGLGGARGLNSHFRAIPDGSHDGLVTRCIRITGWLLVMACVAPACLPGDKAKDLWVVSRCPSPIWVRGSEVGDASKDDFVKESGALVSPGERQRFPIFDNDGDGVTLSVSAVQGEVGKLTTIPHSDADVRTVEIRDSVCP
jgi:hypothetical protein